VDDVPQWLALARGLSEVAPSWVACKSVGGAPTEWGDLPSTAPVEEWDALTQEFRRWAAATRLGPVVVCPHEPHVLHLIALDGPLRFFVLSLWARRVVRGATLFVPETLRPVAELDAWGFRRTRPGAEGVILLLDAVAHDGVEPDWPTLRARDVAALVARDRTGVRETARLLLGPVDRAMVQLADAVEGGRWDRRALTSLQRWCVARSLVEPAVMATWMRHRFTRPCAVVDAMAAGRRVPGDRRDWLDDVAADHSIDAPTAVRQQFIPQKT
jgi:hypothetical protein